MRVLKKFGLDVINESTVTSEMENSMEEGNPYSTYFAVSKTYFLNTFRLNTASTFLDGIQYRRTTCNARQCTLELNLRPDY